MEMWMKDPLHQENDLETCCLSQLCWAFSIHDTTCCETSATYKICYSYIYIPTTSIGLYGMELSHQKASRGLHFPWFYVYTIDMPNCFILNKHEHRYLRYTDHDKPSREIG